MQILRESEQTTVIVPVATNPWAAGVAGNADALRVHQRLTRNGLVLVRTEQHGAQYHHVYVPHVAVPLRPGDQRQGQLVYHLDQIPVTGLTPGASRHLVVTFSHIGAPSELMAADYQQRMGISPFSRLQTWLVKNTLVLRLLDTNLTAGSFFRNTAGAPTFEADVAAVIARVRATYQIARTQTLLYGASKGATAAMYHGLKLGYRFIANDPIVDLTQYAYRPLLLALDDQIALDMVPKLNDLARATPYQGTVIANHHTPESWPGIARLKHLLLHDLNDATLAYHPQVTVAATPVVLGLMNTMLVDLVRR
ncbi:XcbB/CpsF family capsular polysaccharide biosynthesis protein [Lacticaseibacillus daqingensis]|uniref:XcbB/CpsF family capsular polysaccharide biosynthesis protein n=1 Tax=Lacticaseibacillus daqingensis TaxID=2486014 RepID=UPI000F7832A8|nr:XcbB/CpsF family capsular polysaccharide biosynthesis protein [Lacticaseibacillus daqingensis]